ncbi:MAG TPA: hypothetical protein VMM60_08870 [Ilumatobacter sp.]|nr:hypothetical protein [Ilumatobacter sp.]
MSKVTGMVTLLRRVFWLVALSGGAFAAWTVWNRRNSALPTSPPEWPPIEPLVRAAPDATANATTVSSTGDAPTFAAPPTDDAQPTAVSGTSPAAAPVAPPVTAVGTEPLMWVAPDGGSCPDSHPIKANDNSGIYHVPGGRFYNRTGAERCYALADDAEADGYRRAKN